MTNAGEFSSERSDRKRVVVVGGGFGGLHVAQGLRRSNAEVILIDKRNYHLFQPLLYQVAAAALSPADIAMPIRRIFRGQRNVGVILGEVSSVDLDKQIVDTDRGAISYDYLVLAAGATHAYFGNDSWSEKAPGLKTIDDAVEIRRRILVAFEAAELEDDEEARRAQLTFVVVGGGPTGVELAGALREIAANTIPEDFRLVDTKTARIILIEGQGRLLPSMAKGSSAHAIRDLREMGVEVRLETFVTKIDDEAVYIGEERLPAANVIWAAGVQAAGIGRTMEVPLDHAGRVHVEADCSVPGHPEVFVIGDMASLNDPKSGLPIPGVAQGAIQMGQFVSKILSREIAGKSEPRPEFHYLDKGSMATIGKARAVADLWGRSFGGQIAWLMWSVIHVTFLIGFRNRVVVMLSWAWNYVAHARGARLITGSPDVDVKEPVNLREHR